MPETAPLRLLHTADIHLDARFSGLPAGKRGLRRQGLRDTFVRLADLALERRVDAFLIAGDLFDTPKPPADTVHFVTAQFERLKEKGIPVMIIPGNHDHFAADSVFAESAFGDNVHIFTKDSWQVLEMPEKGVNFMGIACHAFAPGKNVLSEIAAGAKDRRTVAILHGSLDYGHYGEDQCYPFTAADLKSLTVDYLALGHYHNCALDQGERVRYPGSPEGLKSTETGPRHALYVELSGGETKLEEVPVSRYLYERLEVDCTMFSTAERIREAIGSLGDKNKLLKVTLTGAPALELDVDIDTIIDSLGENFFQLEIKDKLSLPSDIADDGSNTVKSIFLRKLAERLAAAGDDEQQVINLAVRLGAAALDKRLK